MKRNNNYYNYAYFNGYNHKRKKRKNNNIVNKRINFVVVLFIVLIVLILITITKNQSRTPTAEEESQKALQENLMEQELAKAEKQRKEDERQAKLPKLTDVGRENMKNIYHSETKRAFLTFDDGPSNVTHQILDTLKQENVKATFFVLGRNVEMFPETTNRIYNEGHYIANHGYSHVYSQIYTSPEEVLNEFNMCNEAVQKQLNETEYNSHLFRFPGGLNGGKYNDIKHQAKELLEQNGIMSVDWNALTGDAEKVHIVAEELMDKLASTTEGKNSVVILMHDAEAKKLTAEILPQIIAYLREQGYEFKTFYDIIK
ncbi:MAG: polysaccharide deacetylase [Clostridia bacterium]|nr:polysaccharide deacetylase [Clostridia bacterium]